MKFTKFPKETKVVNSSAKIGSLEGPPTGTGEVIGPIARSNELDPENQEHNAQNKNLNAFKLVDLYLSERSQEKFLSISDLGESKCNGQGQLAVQSIDTFVPAPWNNVVLTYVNKVLYSEAENGLPECTLKSEDIMPTPVGNIFPKHEIFVSEKEK